MKYQLRSIVKRLSFVITPIDTFSGKIASSGVSASVEGPYSPPTVKTEGHLVFQGYPPGDYKVNIISDRYFPERLIVNEGALPVALALIPDRRYKLPKGSTWIEGFFPPDTNIYLIPSKPDAKIISCNEDIIQISTLRPWDFSNRYVAIGPARKLCFVSERLGKFLYKLSSPPEGPWEKNDILAPVSLGRTTKDGYLFCPVACFMPDHKEILMWSEQTDIRAVEITYGAGNYIP